MPICLLALSLPLGVILFLLRKWNQPISVEPPFPSSDMCVYCGASQAKQFSSGIEHKWKYQCLSVLWLLSPTLHSLLFCCVFAGVCRPHSNPELHYITSQEGLSATPRAPSMALLWCCHWGIDYHRHFLPGFVNPHRGLGWKPITGAALGMKIHYGCFVTVSPGVSNDYSSGNAVK